MPQVRWPFIGSTRHFEIVGADGAYLIASDGRRILDAAGGAIVSNVGHGRASVAKAVADATQNETYVVPPWLTKSRRKLLERLERDWLSPRFPHVHLTSGGSEAVETAIFKALDKDPAGRYATVGEFLDALEEKVAAAPANSSAPKSAVEADGAGAASSKQGCLSVLAAWIGLGAWLTGKG